MQEIALKIKFYLPASKYQAADLVSTSFVSFKLINTNLR